MGGGGELDIQTRYITSLSTSLSIDYEDPIVINTLWINLICGIEENMLHRLFIDINKYKWKGISSYFSKSLGIEGYSNVTNGLIILSFIISCKYQRVDFCEIIKGYIERAPRTAEEKAAVAAKVSARREDEERRVLMRAQLSQIKPEDLLGAKEDSPPVATTMKSVEEAEKSPVQPSLFNRMLDNAGQYVYGHFVR